MIDTINNVFGLFDDSIKSFKIEKVKTVGDTYVMVSGIPVTNEAHAKQIVECVFEFLKLINDYNNQHSLDLSLMIGVNSGEIMSGVVGTRKPSYDVWGTTISLAARLSHACIPNMIQISQHTYNLLPANLKTRFEVRKFATIKNVGMVDTFLGSLKSLE